MTRRRAVSNIKSPIVEAPVEKTALQTNASELLPRLALANLLGMSFGGNRDLYNTLGYPAALNYSDFVARYRRQDIAKAVIKRPVETTWTGDLQILESKDAKNTALETGFDALQKKFKLKSKFARLDRLTCLGHYGVLLMGFNDITKREDASRPVDTKKALKLLYVKPLGEGSATIDTYETNASSERFGLPKIYNISLKSTAKGSTELSTLRVHYTRVLHVAWDLMEDEVLGTPVMEAVYNRLMDLEKLVGGSAEMFWKGARPGYQGLIDKDFSMGVTEEENLDKQVDEYENGLRRIFTAQGIKLENLAPQVSDPTAHVAVQVQMVSSETGIPQRVLMGSEQGKLASGQDANAWKVLIQDRRTEQVEPMIIRPFIDKMIEYKILPSPTVDSYTVMWSDLFAPSENERAETGKTRAAAIQQYLQNPIAIDIIPPAVFVEFLLGLSKEQIELFYKMKEDPDEVAFQKQLAKDLADSKVPESTATTVPKTVSKTEKKNV
jgi:hypothetical protein